MVVGMKQPWSTTRFFPAHGTAAARLGAASLAGGVVALLGLPAAVALDGAGAASTIPAAISSPAGGAGGSLVVAEAPQRYTDPVVDSAQVLTQQQVQDLTAQIREFQKTSGKKIFLLFVNSFDGMDGEQWARKTEELSGGDNSVVFAVSVGDSTVSRWAGKDWSKSTVTKARDAGYPHLVDRDYAGFAQAVVDSLSNKTAAGQGGDSGDGSGALWLGAGAGAVALGGGAIWATNRKKQKKQHQDLLGQARQLDPSNPNTADSLASMPLEVLRERAQEEMVSTDDLIHRGEEQLRIATDEFGAERTRPFAKAIQHSKDTMQWAFPAVAATRSQRLPEQQERGILVDVITRAAAADKALAKQQESFSEMRNLLLTADSKLEALTQAIVDLSARLPQAQEQLNALADKHPAATLAAVKDNPAMASEHLRQAERHADTARQLAAQPAGQQQGLVDEIRTAELAISQADTLLGAIERADENIAAAQGAIQDLIAEINREVQEAAQLTGSGRQLGVKAEWEKLEQACAAGKQAVAQAQERGHEDPLGTQQRLLEADAQIDKYLDPVRETTHHKSRQMGIYHNTARTAAAQITAAEDLIATRGRFVGSHARTLLAQAQGAFQHAEHNKVHNTRQAIDEATTAGKLAQQAVRAAQDDIDEHNRRYNSGGGSGNFITGMLIGNMLSGGHGGFGGGFGGGGFGGGGDFGGGGFGGSDSF